MKRLFEIIPIHIVVICIVIFVVGMTASWLAGDFSLFGEVEITFLNGETVECRLVQRKKLYYKVELKNKQEVEIPLASVKWVKKLPKK